MPTAKVLIEERVWAQLELLRARDLRLVVSKIDQLGEFPESAPRVPIGESSDYRRAIAGDYHIYYRHVSEEKVVRVLLVRYGRQMPAALEDIDPNGEPAAG